MCSDRRKFIKVLDDVSSSAYLMKMTLGFNLIYGIIFDLKLIFFFKRAETQSTLAYWEIFFILVFPFFLKKKELHYSTPVNLANHGSHSFHTNFLFFNIFFILIFG